MLFRSNKVITEENILTISKMNSYSRGVEISKLIKMSEGLRKMLQSSKRGLEFSLTTLILFLLLDNYLFYNIKCNFDCDIGQFVTCGEFAESCVNQNGTQCGCLDQFNLDEIKDQIYCVNENKTELFTIFGFLIILSTEFINDVDVVSYILTFISMMYGLSVSLAYRSNNCGTHREKFNLNIINTMAIVISIINGILGMMMMLRKYMVGQKWIDVMSKYREWNKLKNMNMNMNLN